MHLLSKNCILCDSNYRYLSVKGGPVVWQWSLKIIMELKIFHSHRNVIGHCTAFVVMRVEISLLC
jgi:hypothetical protein